MLSTPLLLGLAAIASAKLSVRQISPDSSDSPLESYFAQVCFPQASDGSDLVDFNAPCNANQAILIECLYGTDYFLNGLNMSDTGNSSHYGTDKPTASNAQQQTCFCQSQYFNTLEGCVDCANKHGLSALVPQVASSALTSFSSSYCAASNTPTTDFPDVLYKAFSDVEIAPQTASATSFTDPIGNKTDISAYYTASVTGSALYIVSQTVGSGAASTTGAASSAGITTSAASQSAAISNGQIVATAGKSGVSAASAGASSSSSSGLAAAATPAIEKFAMAGVIGLAGAVIML